MKKKQEHLLNPIKVIMSRKRWKRYQIIPTVYIEYL